MARLRDGGDLDYDPDDYESVPTPPRQPAAPAAPEEDPYAAAPPPPPPPAPNQPAVDQPRVNATPTPDPYGGDGQLLNTQTLNPGIQATGTGPAPAPANPLSTFMEKWLADQNAATAKTGAQRQGLLTKLNSLTDEYSKPVTGDDPSIKNQVFDYGGKVDRANRKYREQAAERGHAEGVASGAFDSQIGEATLQGGRDVGSFEHNLVHDEISARREKLMETLKQGAGLLSDEDTAGIQNRIASMDAMTKNRGLDLTQDRNNNDLRLGLGNLDLGSRGLDLQKLLGMSSIDLQRELGLGNLSVANRNAGTSARNVDNQNTQFYDKFAYDQGRDANNSDEDMLRRLLGGG